MCTQFLLYHSTCWIGISNATQAALREAAGCSNSSFKMARRSSLFAGTFPIPLALWQQMELLAAGMTLSHFVRLNTHMKKAICLLALNYRVRSLMQSIAGLRQLAAIQAGMSLRLNTHLSTRQLDSEVA